MKIYTGTGDRGTTSLGSGERVPKNDARVEAYGTVDELNSVLGALAASLPGGLEHLFREIQGIQSLLLRAGALLAATPRTRHAEHLLPITLEDAGTLESAIDRMEEGLTPLTEFILPGGHASAAWAHIARTVCRRAERQVVRIAHGSDRGKEMEPVLVYLNRLSDYLFVLARHCNMSAGVSDIPWKK
jgi:cob(I)alamin adenosyltransferase